MAFHCIEEQQVRVSLKTKNFVDIFSLNTVLFNLECSSDGWFQRRIAPNEFSNFEHKQSLYQCFTKRNYSVKIILVSSKGKCVNLFVNSK